MSTRRSDIADELRDLLDQDDGRTITEMIEADPYEEWPIEKVEAGRDGWWSITFDGSTGTGVSGREPKVGDIYRSYHGGGSAWGSTRHGWALNGEIVEWKTPWERVAERVTRLAESDRKKRERLEETRADLLRDYAELPEPLRKRLDRFAAERADFWVDSGSYELFCCKEAAKIAEHLRPRVEAGEDAETLVREFYDLPWDEQVKAGVDQGHSGNTFGGACSLARALLTGQSV